MSINTNTTTNTTTTTTIPHEDEPQLEIDAGNGFSSVIALALHLPRHLEICQTYQEEDYCACTFTYSCPLCGKGVHKRRAATKFVGLPSNSKAKRVEYPGKLRLSLMFRPLYEPIYDAPGFVAEQRYEWAAYNRRRQPDGLSSLGSVEEYIACHAADDVEASLAKYRLGLDNECGFQVFPNGKPE
jgi:hypothetical protein